MNRRTSPGRRARRRAPLIVVTVALLMTVLAPPAAADTPHLDDGRDLGPIGVVADACNTVLGPFQDAFDFFNLSVCPSVAGRVLAHPQIWNIYASGDWDAANPASLSRTAIDNLTRGIVDASPGNNYLGQASQYGVGAASFKGSSQNNGCSGAPSGTTNSLSIMLWLTCEVQAPGTGVPYPDDNSLYVIYLPASVDINNGPLNGTCDSFAAYHFQSIALTIDLVTENILGIDVPVPPFFHPHFQSYPFAVIPLKCAQHTYMAGATAGSGPLRVDLASRMASHEIVEAATDPIVPRGWADNSTIDFSTDFLKKGEAADICEPSGGAPAKPRRLNNGILVEPYWSNQLTACVPVIHTLTLKTVGLPTAGEAYVTSRAIWGDGDAHTQALPHAFCTDDTRLSAPSIPVDCVVENAQIAWRFPQEVSGGPGIRYVTGNTGDDIFMDADINDTATYGKQFYLTTNTSPSGVAALATSLTASQWVPAGSTIGINTDEFVASGANRYRFRYWTGDVSSIFTTTNVLMDAPKTATADYVLQHLINFAQAGIPSGVPWNVTVRETDHAGPYSEWFDEFTSVSFAFQDPVPALTPGTRYKLVSTSATSPLSVVANGTVTATYKAQHLLTVRTSGLPSPNLASIANGATVLGTVNDSTPLQVWIDDGATLALAGDANVNGVDGTQYFAQQFSPTPPATLTGPFDTTLTYKTMKQLIADALAGGGIVGPNAAGVGTALTKQFAAVEADMGAKRYVPALGDLSAFVNLVRSQCCTPKTGMSITPPTAKMLQLDAMLVYHSALCLGKESLSAKQMKQSYAYYEQLVTSLGGTVLPPCS